MITKIEVWDANHISSVELDTLTYPLQKFAWEYPIVGDTIPRPFSSGRHDTRKSVGYMTLDCEGEILGSSTSNYWVNRKALVAKILPARAQTPSVYRHSYIEVTLDDSTKYHADLQLTSYSVPMTTTGAPTISPFMFSWEINVGYWLSDSGVATLL